MSDLILEASLTDSSSAYAPLIPTPTGISGIHGAATQRPTQISALLRTATARALVTQADDLTADVRDTHANALTQELSVRTQQIVKQSPQTMLAALGDRGFSWRAVARLVDVSVPALQKWRRGDGVSGENRRKLAALIAGIDIVASQYVVEQIESWFETPITDGIPVTPIDLWAGGHYVLALRYASEELTAEAVLDEYEPSWRTRWESNFVTFRASDGNISIAAKG